MGNQNEKLLNNLKEYNKMENQKEEWMNVQERKILLYECKQFVLNFILASTSTEEKDKGKLIEQSRELINKLKNY